MTLKQKELLDFIANYQREQGGVSPTYREMMGAMGLASTSGIRRLLDGLEVQGYIRRHPSRARTVEVVRKVGEPVRMVRPPTAGLGKSVEDVASYLAARLHVPEWRIRRALLEMPA